MSEVIYNRSSAYNLPPNRTIPTHPPLALPPPLYLTDTDDMCLSEVLARHAHELPAAVAGPSQASSAYSDSELGDDVMDSSSDVASSSSMSHGPTTPDATTARHPSRPVLSLLTQIRPKYPVRANERLAVLLPKSLWKPDNMADECDIWTCATQFSLFERRHHCRKCGGVFCQACSSQQTPLLDTTDLPFFYPPADVSLDDGPIGPMVDSRVCDDCHALIHGRPTPSSMAAQSCLSDVPTLSNSVSSASSSTVPFPSRPALSRTSSNLSAERARLRRNSAQQPKSSASSARSVNFNSHPAHRRTVVPEPPAPSDLGVLSTYPLRQPSAQCKASGGGLWQPRQSRYDSRASRTSWQRLVEEDDESDDEGMRRPRRTRMIVDGEIKVCHAWEH